MYSPIARFSIWIRSTWLLLVILPGVAAASEKVCSPQQNLVASSAESAVASLRNAAQGSGLMIGTAMGGKPGETAELYWEVAAREFSGVAPENAMKWEVIHPQRDLYDFCVADALVRFAQQRGMHVRGHTLVWTQQLPAWLTKGNFSRSEMIEILRDHIATVVGHYRRLFPGVVTQWDVVNEGVAPCEGPQACGMEGGFWKTSIGTDYMAMAFTFARAADPSALLFYNDDGFEFGPQHPARYAKHQGVLNLLRWLLQNKIPVDGVGLQLHIDASPTSAEIPTATELGGIMSEVAALGLDFAITELDVSVGTALQTEWQQGTQADLYGRALDACLAQARCHTFFMWGYTDLATWRAPDAVCILDRRYAPKSAYVALRNRLAARKRLSVGEINSRDAGVMRRLSSRRTQIDSISKDVLLDHRRLRKTGERITYPVSARVPGTYSSSLMARGVFGGSAWPQLEIQLDGNHVADIVVDSFGWKTYDFPMTIPVGAHVVQAIFTNDFYRPPEDRDVDVADLSVDTKQWTAWRRLGSAGDELSDEIALGGADEYAMTVVARSVSETPATLEVQLNDKAVAEFVIDSKRWQSYRAVLRANAGGHRLALTSKSGGAELDVLKVSIATPAYGKPKNEIAKPTALAPSTDAFMNASITVTAAARYLFLVTAYRDTTNISGMLNITVDGRPIASGEVGDTEWTTARIIASLPAGTHDIGVVAPRGNVHLREFRIEPVASDD